MAKEKFNLGKLLAENVSDLNTLGRDQIEYIDLDKLNGDPDNFYSIEGIEELAANIALIGLQQPIRVRPDETDIGAYRIVSGHRRTAALRLLKKDDAAKWGHVACIVERDDISDAMQELRLIYANSDTRVMSSAEIALQAERVTAIFEQLKADGVEFQGRIRDHVAKVCNVSSSKLARLQAIRYHLIEQFCGPYEKGELSESCAYRISQEDSKVQQALAFTHGIRAVSSMTEQQLGNVIEQIKAPAKAATAEPIDFKTLDKVIRGESFNADDYLETLRQENKAFMEGMREFCGELLVSRLDMLAPNRTESINSLKRACRNAGHLSRAGGYTGSNKGLRMETVKHGHITRSWAETWDALAMVALERMRYAVTFPDKCTPGAAGAWQPLSLLNEPKSGQRVIIAGICDGEKVYSERVWRPLNAFEQSVYKFWAPINEPDWEG